MSSNPGDTGQTVGFSFECVYIYIYIYIILISSDMLYIYIYIYRSVFIQVPLRQCSTPLVWSI